MGLVDIVPEFNLYQEFSPIYTKCDILPPQYIGQNAVIEKCLIGEGAEIYGEVYHSIIGSGVIVEEGAVVRDSIVMQDCIIEAGAKMDKAIIAENVRIGRNAQLGVGDYKESRLDTKIYVSDLVTIAENSVIPENVKIGKNTAIVGVTVPEDYENGLLDSGDYIIKEGESR